MKSRSLRSSLSAKLLVMTILFVMLAEVLIFAPSVARFRESGWKAAWRRATSPR